MYEGNFLPCQSDQSDCAASTFSSLPPCHLFQITPVIRCETLSGWGHSMRFGGVGVWKEPFPETPGAVILYSITPVRPSSQDHASGGQKPESTNQEKECLAPAVREFWDFMIVTGLRALWELGNTDRILLLLLRSAPLHRGSIKNARRVTGRVFKALKTGPSFSERKGNTTGGGGGGRKNTPGSDVQAHTGTMSP
ncbi:hypothetical protein SKAU_G00429780 [Synaphobranchus kaupii]|uniref:Uncharacterized protein n=1 Tax=Synaphobranchus kaupii TaxID=118154 RepID=A0A9Q1I992_SYNKA|nr:hypothetical protein SKAU_G00429780 [Synaphobranchus kaupii]